MLNKIQLIEILNKVKTNFSRQIKQIVKKLNQISLLIKYFQNNLYTTNFNDKFKDTIFNSQFVKLSNDKN